jgi:carbonic anhydrase
MRRNIAAIGILVAVALIFCPAYAAEQAGHKDEVQQIKSFVHKIVTNNAEFMKKHGANYFKPFIESQHPKATVITCSDSRVQMHMLDSTPDNELFVVRNIGNQFSTAEGSVEYGVHHLHTPVLLIVGHVRCGAIKAASGDYSGESPAIRRELDTIKITKGADSLESVKANVDNQVSAAMTKFGSEVKEGGLIIVGAVYDFANDLKQGYGKLVILTINGDSGPAKLKSFTSER